MKTKSWIIGYLAIVLAGFVIIGSYNAVIDPYFHYHAPIDGLFYPLNHERCQNDGIAKHFTYDAVISGTSMAENFKTSELDELFGTSSVKLPFSGAKFRELCDNLRVAFNSKNEIKMVVLSMDQYAILADEKLLVKDYDENLPTYLYDNNPFNDVKYLLNKDVLFSRSIPISIGTAEGSANFDAYANWMKYFSETGRERVEQSIKQINQSDTFVELTELEKKKFYDNIRSNFISLAQSNPDTAFYCFLPPYSIAQWRVWYKEGSIYKQIETMKLLMEESLQYENIRLFCFYSETDMITDYDVYRDLQHYIEPINSYILQCMSENKCLVTKGNYESLIDQMTDFYTNYDYEND